MFRFLRDEKNNPWKTIFIIFIVVYVLLLLVKTDLGVTGSDIFLLRTLQAGKPMILYSPDFPINSMKMGRFVPLVSMEYNILNLFSKSPSAFWYYFIHAVQYVVFMALFTKIISKFIKSKFLIYMIPVLASLFPGMIVAWFQTMYLERDLIFFFTIFIFFYLSYLEKPKTSYLIWGLLSANLSLYYKENAFIPIGIFAFCHLIFSRKNNENPLKMDNGILPNSNNNNLPSVFPNKTKRFDILLILSSALYLGLYLFLVFIPYHSAALTYGAGYSIANLIKSILNYIFVIDPVIMLVALPLLAWRAYRILIKRDKPEPIYDSLLAAGLMYVISFFVLNLFYIYYFAPIYVFVIPPLIYFIPKVWNGKMFGKISASLLGLLIIFNTLPLALHWLTFNKYTPINLNKTLDFLVKEINSKPNKRTNLFIAGTERCYDKWIYFNFSEFLLYRGLTSDQFDLKADEERTLNCDETIDVDLPLERFTVFQKGPLPKIHKGDYLIITPENSDPVKNSGDKKYLESLNNEYSLVFRTKSAFAFPMLNLKETIRYFLSIGSSPDQKLFGISRKKPFMRWPDYYVFIKK